MKRNSLLAVAVAAALCTFPLLGNAHGDRDDGDDGRWGRHQPADPRLVAARVKFFGAENVDGRGRVKKDKVIFSWATNTTYVVSVQGRVMLLDSYINHAELP